MLVDHDNRKSLIGLKMMLRHYFLENLFTENTDCVTLKAKLCLHLCSVYQKNENKNDT